jgi:hypothetical protein
MSSKVKAIRPKSSQHGKFASAARELGCDEDEAAFDERLRKIAKAQPPKEDKPKRKPKKAS